MTAPACDIYFGSPPSLQGDGTYKPPRPNPSWANPSITVENLQGAAITRDANGMVDVQSGQYLVKVDVYNAGVFDASTNTGNADNTRVELVWGQPSTATPLAQIAQANVAAQVNGVWMPTTSTIASGTVPAISSLGPSGAVFETTWYVDTTAPITGGTTSIGDVNGGHVCLWARASRSADASCGQAAMYDPSNPFGDWFSAVQNVMVAPTMMERRPRCGWWSFAFVVANPTRFPGESVLVARAYDTALEEDRERARAIVTRHHVRRAIGRCAKVALPAAVRVGIGRDTAHARATRFVAPPILAIGDLGPLRCELAEHLLRGKFAQAAGRDRAEHRVHLEPGQLHHAVVQVDPAVAAREGHLHVVDISQTASTPAGPVHVGGLTVVFAPQSEP